MNSFKQMTQVFALALCLALPAAHAALDRIEEAYEVAPGDVRIPAYNNGRLTVSPCEGCDEVALRASVFTRYFAGSPRLQVSRAELIEAASSSTVQANGIVYVFFNPETLEVTRVVLDAD